MTRLYFCTDLHGSEVCFRKFLHAGAAYRAETIVMGGDCTGKMAVPFISEATGYRCGWESGPQGVFELGAPLDAAERQVSDMGLYPVRMSPNRYQELQQSPDEMQLLLTTLMTERLRAWIQLAEQRLGSTKTHVVMTPGNDDEFVIDSILAEATLIDTPNGSISQIDDEFEMLNLSWANPTPWHTPRECSEEELTAKIERLAAQISNMNRAVFNIHVPPFGTGLDVAPELREGQRMVRGGVVVASVGSTAVRDAILKYQPLLSLHGHIHESRATQRLGRTLCVNPGSTYSSGTLQGVVVDLDVHKGIKSHALVSG